MKLITRYKDDELVGQAEKTLGDDPQVDMSRLEITSHKGVVTIQGRVRNNKIRAHILDEVRRSYQRKGLKFEKIVDEMVVPQPA